VCLTTGRSLATWIPGTTIQSSPRNVHHHTWSPYVQKQRQNIGELVRTCHGNARNNRRQSLLYWFFFEMLMQKVWGVSYTTEAIVTWISSNSYETLLCYLITASFKTPPLKKIFVLNHIDNKKTFHPQKSYVCCAFNCYFSFVHSLFDRSRILNKKNSLLWNWLWASERCDDCVCPPPLREASQRLQGQARGSTGTIE